MLGKLRVFFIFLGGEEKLLTFLAYSRKKALVFCFRFASRYPFCPIYSPNGLLFVTFTISRRLSFRAARQNPRHSPFQEKPLALLVEEALFMMPFASPPPFFFGLENRSLAYII